jgi:hypothetical protein
MPKRRTIPNRPVVLYNPVLGLDCSLTIVNEFPERETFALVRIFLEGTYSRDASQILLIPDYGHYPVDWGAMQLPYLIFRDA